MKTMLTMIAPLALISLLHAGELPRTNPDEVYPALPAEAAGRWDAPEPVRVKIRVVQDPPVPIEDQGDEEEPQDPDGVPRLRVLIQPVAGEAEVVDWRVIEIEVILPRE